MKIVSNIAGKLKFNIALNIASNTARNIARCGCLYLSRFNQMSCWKCAKCGWISNTVARNIADNIALSIARSRCGCFYK